MPELLNPAPVAHLRHLLRAHSPLVHCMTNDVVQTFTANVLLAVGASPAMVIDPREAAQFAAIADALLINVGTLTEDRAVAMRAAVEHARQAGRPWTLDPVAVGALTVRTAFCHELLVLQPAAIRGNASEILALAGMSAGGRGVDTTDTAAAALPAAQALGVLRQLGVPDDAAHVNPNGGAIALGHPLGMSGARLALSASLELQRRGGRYALCTMCIGVGQGIAMILERV